MDWKSAAPGPGCISANPQFVDPVSDWHLQSTSVCIDARTDVNAPALDIDGLMRPANGDGINGAEFDIGACEYGAVSGGTGGGGGAGVGA